MLLQDFVDDMLIEVPAASELSITRAVRFAFQEFCRQSEAYRISVNIPFLPFTGIYSVPLPDDTYIASIVKCSVDGYKLDFVLPTDVIFKTGDRPQTVSLSADGDVLFDSDNDGAGKASIELVLQPTRTFNVIPDSLGNAFFEGIRAGALSRMLLMPNQPWSNVSGAANYGQIFNNSILEAKREARNDRSRPVRKAKFNRGFVW